MYVEEILSERSVSPSVSRAKRVSVDVPFARFAGRSRHAGPQLEMCGLIIDRLTEIADQYESIAQHVHDSIRVQVAITKTDHCIGA